MFSKKLDNFNWKMLRLVKKKEYLFRCDHANISYILNSLCLLLILFTVFFYEQSLIEILMGKKNSTIKNQNYCQCSLL